MKRTGIVFIDRTALATTSRQMSTRVNITVARGGNVVVLASANEPVVAHNLFPDVNVGQRSCSSRLVFLYLVTGNPGFTAGRGFNQAGGAPGGG
ncbi:hypothetical protein F511_40408 [Dorcoceras hygrometricum]|uniref:Uncharacterized protein n=1 Tax=Dorcoceras hygrometricum TaxID=472368 RepID=A0A2Z7C5Y7_9LAMI|nr:hypothetical protein F511_40408 [Dorcoceras hygrometricum]